VTRAAPVEDAAMLIRGLALAPVTLVGQSLGGHTAMLLAAAHPGLVGSLTLVEAGPAGPSPDLPAQIAHWLDTRTRGRPSSRTRLHAAVTEFLTTIDHRSQ
jgi:pimeloyl-ACP methyl ester carboxylesterase